MTSASTAIDNGMGPGPTAGGAPLTHQPLGLPEPELGPDAGTKPDKGREGVRGPLPVITNGYEQPPYRLNSKG